MFEGPIIEWDENKNNLMYWLMFYNKYIFSIDEEERPSDYIIKYNVLMDDWVERKLYREKQKDKENTSVRTGKQIETYHLG